MITVDDKRTKDGVFLGTLFVGSTFVFDDEDGRGQVFIITGKDRDSEKRVNCVRIGGGETQGDMISFGSLTNVEPVDLRIEILP